MDDMKEDNTPTAVRHFVLLCDKVVQKFKTELKALKPHRVKPTWVLLDFLLLIIVFETDISTRTRLDYVSFKGFVFNLMT